MSISFVFLFGGLLFKSNSECEVEPLVDFNDLKPLNTSLSKQDVIEIYRIVIIRWEGRPNEDTRFLNPFAHPTLPMYHTDDFTNRHYESLPEELTNNLPYDYRFAYWEDVYDGQEISCDREFFILTAPRILPNGTVIIQIQNHLENIVRGGEKYVYSAGVEFHLIKDLENTWKIIYSKTLFISHS